MVLAVFAASCFEHVSEFKKDIAELLAHKRIDGPDCIIIVR